MIHCHGWRGVGVGGSTLLFAFVTAGLTLSRQAGPKPQGESAPSIEELTRPGGADLDALQRAAPQRSSEVYTEFDHRESVPGKPCIFTFSYGERAPSLEGLDFYPFIQRAEACARFSFGFMEEGPIAANEPLKIVKRDWFSIADTNLVTVQLYFEV